MSYGRPPIAAFELGRLREAYRVGCTAAVAADFAGVGRWTADKYFTRFDRDRLPRGPSDYRKRPYDGPVWIGAACVG